jgi:hypothetical protein
LAAAVTLIANQEKAVFFMQKSSYFDVFMTLTTDIYKMEKSLNRANLAK